VRRNPECLAPSDQLVGFGHPTPRQARGAAVGGDAEGGEAAVAAPMRALPHDVAMHNMTAGLWRGGGRRGTAAGGGRPRARRPAPDAVTSACGLWASDGAHPAEPAPRVDDVAGVVVMPCVWVYMFML